MVIDDDGLLTQELYMVKCKKVILYSGRRLLQGGFFCSKLLPLDSFATSTCLQINQIFMSIYCHGNCSG